MRIKLFTTALPWPFHCQVHCPYRFSTFAQQQHGYFIICAVMKLNSCYGIQIVETGIHPSRTDNECKYLIVLGFVFVSRFMSKDCLSLHSVSDNSYTICDNNSKMQILCGIFQEFPKRRCCSCKKLLLFHHSWRHLPLLNPYRYDEIKLAYAAYIFRLVFQNVIQLNFISLCQSIYSAKLRNHIYWILQFTFLLKVSG